MRHGSRPLLLASLALWATTLVRANVFSIDYGTDWFKVAMVQNQKLDIVLNVESARKTASTVVVQDVTRWFANDAVNRGTRFPSQSYPAVKPLLGRGFHDEHSKSYRATFQNTMREDPERGTAVFSHTIDGKDVTMSVEEVLGMQFAYARKIAEREANATMVDVVITVPPYFTQFERQAVLDAAEIAGLRVMQLIHDNTAVALSHARDRTFTEKPAYHIFYDSGAGSTVASLISFANTVVPIVKGSKVNRTVPEVEVRAVGYDRTLGGHEIDLRIQKWLAAEFTRQHKGKLKGDVYKDQRAMMKLFKESKRVKQILSANVDTQASVEGLMEDIDFRATITRATLEELCADLIDRVTGPLEDVLTKTGLQKSDIESLVLVGGNVRVPFIQEQLKKYIGVEKIAKNINGDEAAAVGAAFRAASLSVKFNIKKEIRIKEINQFPIEIKYAGGADARPVSTVIYKSESTFGSKKIMTFKKKGDFQFSAAYGVEEDEKTFGPKEICAVEIGGVAQALETFQNSTVEESKVKIAMKLTNSGMFTTEEGFLELETLVKEDKVESVVVGESGKNETETADTTATDSGSANATASSEKSPQRATKKVPLKLTISPRGILPLSEGQKRDATLRQKRMDQAERESIALEDARNGLESFIYRVQRWILDDAVNLVSTPQQREELTKRLSEAAAWLENEERAGKAEIEKQLDKLKSLESPIAFRLSEHTNRPEAVSDLQKALSAAREVVAQQRQMNTLLKSEGGKFEPGEISEEPLNTLSIMLNETERWMTTNELAQSARQLTEEGAFTSADVIKRTKDVQAGVTRLLAHIKAEGEKLMKKLAKEAKEAEAEAVAESGKTDSPSEPTETPSEDTEAKDRHKEKHDEL